MQESHQKLTCMHELRRFVHATLCNKESLLAEQFQMREAALMSRGARCAMQFTVRGPRSIKLGAIWAIDQAVIFFYDTQGERYLKVNLDPSITIRLPEKVA